MLKKPASFLKVKAEAKVELNQSGSSLAAALFGKRRVSARRGWAGEKAGHFEHPAGVFSCWATCADHRSSREST